MPQAPDHLSPLSRPLLADAAGVRPGTRLPSHALAT
jgi:hypothetical protein